MNSPRKPNKGTPFPWPDRETGGRRLGKASFFCFAAIWLLIASMITFAMLKSPTDANQSVILSIIPVAVLFAIEMWLTVIKRLRFAFTLLRFAAYATTAVSFAFDIYFVVDALAQGTTFQLFGSANLPNMAVIVISLSIASNISSLVAVFSGRQNDWFYAASDNDSWD
jgi:peptidoglycan/LPS O-acetylase OafA/YrhL